MSRKVIHGWSNRQQGGFRQASRGRMVYQRPKKVDQTLTLAQAASMDYDVVSLCQDFTCLFRDERRAVNIVADNRGGVGFDAARSRVLFPLSKMWARK